MLDGRGDYFNTLAAPDDGEGNAGEVACSNDFGFLPFADLGVHPVDRWGHRYIYAVTDVDGGDSFVFKTEPGQPPAVGRLDLSDEGVITVYDRRDNRAEVASARIAAVVVSLGINGNCGTDINDVERFHEFDVEGPCLPDDWPADPTITSDELENLNGDMTLCVAHSNRWCRQLR